MISPFRTSGESNDLLPTLNPCSSRAPLGTSLVRHLKLPHLSGTFRYLACQAPLGTSLYIRVRQKKDQERTWRVPLRGLNSLRSLSSTTTNFNFTEG